LALPHKQQAFPQTEKLQYLLQDGHGRLSGIIADRGRKAALTGQVSSGINNNAA
jgi:hypothetical protein